MGGVTRFTYRTYKEKTAIITVTNFLLSGYTQRDIYTNTESCSTSPRPGPCPCTRRPRFSPRTLLRFTLTIFWAEVMAPLARAPRLPQRQHPSPHRLYPHRIHHSAAGCRLTGALCTSRLQSTRSRARTRTRTTITTTPRSPQPPQPRTETRCTRYIAPCSEITHTRSSDTTRLVSKQ